MYIIWVELKLLQTECRTCGCGSNSKDTFDTFFVDHYLHYFSLYENFLDVSCGLKLFTYSLEQRCLALLLLSSVSRKPSPLWPSFERAGNLYELK